MKYTRLAGLVGAAVVLACAAGTTASAAITQYPSAPAPQVPALPQGLTGADAASFQEALEEADKGNWQAALHHIGKVQNTVGSKIIHWLRLREEDSGASLAEITAFREQNPTWPDQSALAMRAEQALLDYAIDDVDLITWFTGQEPITGEAKLRLGAAFIAASRTIEGEIWIQRGWIEHAYSATREKEILAQYGAYLPMQVHEDRLHNLLWERRYSNARRMAKLVGKDSQKLAEARIKLMSRSAGVDHAVSLVPVHLQNDPGLLFDRARFKRRRGREEEALPLLLTAPGEPHLMQHLKLWWTERHIAARQALEKGLYLEAYALTQAHGLTEGADFADAEFLAGWIALQFLNKPDLAAGHFKTLDYGVRTPISKARAAYWRARAAAAGGQLDEAGRHYNTATAYPTTFYGQLAIAALEAVGGDGKLRLPTDPQPSPTIRTTLTQNESAQAIRLLHDADAKELVRTFTLSLARQLSTAEEIATLADIAMALGLPNLSVRVTKEAAKRNMLLPERSYPLATVPKFTPKGPPVELALVYGLSRQESEFDPQAVSHAGARGLMQLMPSTAKLVARQISVPYNRSRLLTDPAYNAMLGTAHLGDLLSEFTGSYVMTIAAYNAGAHRVSQWVSRFGDPRSAAVDPIDWVETIPFSETRNYVQRVLENTQIYRNRLKDTDLPVRLDEDLRRNTGIALTAPPPPRGALIPLTPPRAAILTAPTAPAQIALTTPAPSPIPASPPASLAPPTETPLPQSAPPQQHPAEQITPITDEFITDEFIIGEDGIPRMQPVRDPADPGVQPASTALPPLIKTPPPQSAPPQQQPVEQILPITDEPIVGKDNIARMHPIRDPADPHNDNVSSARTPAAQETTASVAGHPPSEAPFGTTRTPLDTGDAVRPPNAAIIPPTITR